jgi:hypothetical protein
LNERKKDVDARHKAGHDERYAGQTPRRFSDSIFKKPEGMSLHSRGANAPELLLSCAPLPTEGAGKTGCTLAPAISCAKCASRKRTRAYRFSGGNPAFPAQWFYGLCCALLGDEFVLATVIGELTALPNPVGFAKPPPI